MEMPLTPSSGVAQADADFSMRAILIPLITIIVGIFMVILDGTAVNVALPSLVRDLGSPLTTIQWTVVGYTLAQAAVIPLAGWMSDRFGAKRIFLLSIALFTVGSVLCATAQSANWLIAFRVIQGLGGGCVLPIAMAYVYRLAPPSRVGAVMGIMGIPILFAPAIGPVVAGWLVQYHSWRWIFLLNLPIGVIGVLVGLRHLPKVDRQTVADLDLPGTILGPLAFASLSYGISQGSTSWTSSKAIGGMLVGAVALAAFIVVELRARSPLLELRVFQSVDFDLAIVVQWIGQFALFGVIFLIPLFLQQVRGYGAFDTGLILLPQALAAAVIMPLGGVLFDRVGARPLVVVGVGMIGVSSFLLAHISAGTNGWSLVLPLTMAGAGMGLMMMPLNTHLLNTAPRKLVTRVTSLTAALQMVVNSLTVAGLATILTSRTAFHVNAARASAIAHHLPSPALAAALMRAAARAFDDAFYVMVGAAVVGMLLGFLLRRTPAQEVEVGADATEVA